MFELLEKLRNKPEKTRRNIAAVVTGFVAVIFFSFWLVATVWKIEHPQTSDVATSSIVSDVSNFVQNAQNNAPAVSF